MVKFPMCGPPMAAQEFAELRHILDRAPALKGVAQQKTGWLVVWNMDYDFPLILGIIIPTDEFIFSEGVGIPPTRCNGSTLHRHTSRNENSLRAILLCGFSLCLFCAEILPGAAAVFFFRSPSKWKIICMRPHWRVLELFGDDGWDEAGIYGRKFSAKRRKHMQNFHGVEYVDTSISMKQ